MSSLNATIVQSNLVWEDKDANLKKFSEKLNNCTGDIDLIVLPEMFTTGFTMNTVQMAETMDGKTVSWMADMAAKKNSVLVGSAIIKENDNYFNRLVWMRPDGTYEYYDKRHLFRMANEHHYFSSGDKKLVVELKGWKIRPFVCYDLRFPVWSRNVGDYDIAIYIANWPESRSDAWRTLLAARAIENQAYVIGVNRVGEDGKGLYYSGDSVVNDYRGHMISKIRANWENVETIKLSKDSLNEFREKFPVGMDADNFNIL